MVIRVKRAHRALVKPMIGSQDSPLVYEGLITCCFSSSKSRNSWSFFLLAANESHHSLSVLPHFFLRLKRYKFLLGHVGVPLKAFTWLLTSLCWDHSVFFGHCQNWMVFWLLLLRKAIILLAIGRIILWRGLGESVMTVMVQVSLLSMAGISPRCMDISSALMGIIFIVCRLS